MADDPAALAAEFRYSDGTDRWRVWRGVNGTVYAWLLKSEPPQVLRDHSLDGLRKRMTEFEKVLAADGVLSEALAAAERLTT